MRLDSAAVQVSVRNESPTHVAGFCAAVTSVSGCSTPVHYDYGDVAEDGACRRVSKTSADLHAAL